MKQITAAAIRYRGVVYTLPPPNRHFQIITFLLKQLGEDRMGENQQGFIDEEGTFLTRKGALAVALDSKQILPTANVRGDQLYSEDLW